MLKSTALWIVGLTMLTATAACVGSGVPTQPPDAVATIVAGTMAAITPLPTRTEAPPTLLVPTLGLSTSAADPTAAPPTLQPVYPTAALPNAARITFLNGATTGAVSATIQAGAAQAYVLQASQGQIMMVNVDSADHDVTLSIKTQGGTSMLSAAAHQATWQQALPATEDYYLTVHGGAAAQNFTLTVTIPSRIKFPEGAFSVKIPGKTAGGYNVLYAAFAIEGQKMSVELGNLSGEAALTIYGYTDGTPYVRYVSEQTSFSFRLPSTQDYIIEVVPKAGRVVSYLLIVKIQ